MRRGLTVSDGERASRSESEPFGLVTPIVGDQPSEGGEVCDQPGSNEHVHLLGQPG